MDVSLKPPSKAPAPLPVIIDTDPGVDDALALAFALRSGLYDVRAVTVVSGNCPIDTAVENTLRVLEVAASADSGGMKTNLPPVYRGADGPLRAERIGAEHVHGNEGLGGVCSLLVGEDFRYPAPVIHAAPGHAVDRMIEIVESQPGEVTLVTLAPLTNVALAVRKAPETMAKLRGIVMMAGAFRVAGNTTPVAEYNAWADPDALHDVLEFVKSARERNEATAPRLTFVGLDATNTAILLRKRLETAIHDWTLRDPSDRLPRFLLDVTETMMRFYRENRAIDGLHLHDPLAMLLTARPDLCDTETMAVAVERFGEHTRGMMVIDERGWNLPFPGVPAEVVTTVNSVEAEAVFLGSLVGHDPSGG